MAAIKNLALRNAVIELWAPLWDQGASPAPSQLILRRADGEALVSLPLAADAFGAADDGAVAALGLPLIAIATLSGDAVTADLVSADESKSITGLTVAEAAAEGVDVVVQNVRINLGQKVLVSLFTWSERELV